MAALQRDSLLLLLRLLFVFLVIHFQTSCLFSAKPPDGRKHATARLETPTTLLFPLRSSRIHVELQHSCAIARPGR